VSHRDSFIADQRGSVAFEMPIVWLFMTMSLLLPLTDLAVAGFQFLSAWEALRNFGQYTQDNPPPDVTTWQTSAWMSRLNTAAAVAGITNFQFQVLCGEPNPATICSSSNTNAPKYYLSTTTVTLSPMVLGPVFNCPNKPTPCSFKLSYSEQFQ
jgi:hypothetical protein